MRMPDQLPPIPLRLKKLAEKLGITQRRIATATGMSLGAVNTWLSTGAVPRRTDLAAA
jgi:transcriptional regulator with XRE-family HTH domain